METTNLSTEQSLLDMVPNNIALHSVATTSTLLIGKDKTVHHNVTSIVSLEQCVKKPHAVSIVEEAPNNSQTKDRPPQTKIYQPKYP